VIHLTSPATGFNRWAIFTADRRISGEATTAMKVRNFMAS
jgi:hypothetical protein